VTAARILIVDDDPDVRRLLGEELQGAGHEALFASDAVQALMIARRDQPDLILLDLRLPGGDGIAVLKRLKGMPQTEAVPVIILTGLRTNELVDEALRLGAHAYVRKSLTGSQLGQEVERALEPLRRKPLELAQEPPAVMRAASSPETIPPASQAADAAGVREFEVV
jgi:two-component system nitrogen regulation response regulator NtrX